MSPRFPLWAATVATLLLAGADAAALQQPDNTVIPQGASLQNLFIGRGEAISALNDAVTVPETFTPTCNLEFEVLQRNAGYSNSFGWYNVTGVQPQPNEMYEFLACTDAVGTVKALNIANDPNYLGGDIGFYQAAGPGCPVPGNAQAVFFSEKAYNPDNTQQNPYIHLIIYDSTVTPQAFYFAWEDLLVGGDNDFDDLTTFVTGISCTGGGAACQTGQPGVCADGTLQCQNGQLNCLPLTMPTPETCDGLDNDCDGPPDDEDDGPLCPTNEVCDQGTCVPKCSGVEFPCPADKICNDDGFCVDPECEEVSCPSGTKCVMGACVAPCDGVICPYAQTCLVGACVDPCTLFTCDPNQVCELGACIEKCECAGCPSNETCQPSGLCLPDACLNVSCPPGFHCDDSGNCIDDCDGAVCPGGQICFEGNCIDDPNGSGGGGQGGMGPGLSVGAGGDAGGDGGSSGEGGAGGATAAPRIESKSGCGCETPGGSGGASPAWLLLALWWWRRRGRAFTTAPR